MPVIIRVDGCHFHTYTKGCKRPVDDGLVEVMNITAKHLCKNIQGCQMAYVQSDEISLLLNNYQTLDTQPWYDNSVQKMVSVSAAMASVAFTTNSWKIWGFDAYGPLIKEAYFDGRAFVLPKEDVCNYFLWRQQDATRNSVQMLARTLYSHKQLINKNNSELQELIFQKGFNWDKCPTSQKRGRCIVKTSAVKPATNPKTGQTVMVERSEWTVDNETPIFSKDRDYVNRYVDRSLCSVKDMDWTLDPSETNL
jgi:tRNA(His) 5'-end guanylyltransferase